MAEKVAEVKIVVVKELPVFTTREVIDEEGKERECITVEEAITEILETVRELRKKL